MDNIVKTEVPGLVKDMRTGAILNTDTEKLRAYKAQKKAFTKSEELGNEINNLKNRMSSIEDKLNRILEKLS